mmetsp:Transcript_35622/g.80415  ORF Transcript_35622/g.80415 Transcript_35622/m.80415 type:complete len:313 (-) Transcript_35622:299-1237(-)
MTQLRADHWAPTDLAYQVLTLPSTQCECALLLCAICQEDRKGVGHSCSPLSKRICHHANEIKLWCLRQACKAEANDAIEVKGPERFIRHVCGGNESHLDTVRVCWTLSTIGCAAQNTDLVFYEDTSHLTSAERDSDLVPCLVGLHLSSIIVNVLGTRGHASAVSLVNSACLTLAIAARKNEVTTASVKNNLEGHSGRADSECAIVCTFVERPSTNGLHRHMLPDKRHRQCHLLCLRLFLFPTHRATGCGSRPSACKKAASDEHNYDEGHSKGCKPSHSRGFAPLYGLHIRLCFWLHSTPFRLRLRLGFCEAG